MARELISFRNIIDFFLVIIAVVFGYIAGIIPNLSEYSAIIITAGSYIVAGIRIGYGKRKSENEAQKEIRFEQLMDDNEMLRKAILSMGIDLDE